MSTLTFSLSLSLPLLLLALPCRWPSSQFPQHTPVKSCHSSTVPLGDQLANYSSSLELKVWRRTKHWFPTLISSLNLGSSLELGSIIVRSSFSSVQVRGETLVRSTSNVPCNNSAPWRVSWWRNGSAYSSSHPGDVQWPQCQAILVTHRKTAQPHFPKSRLSPLTFPCSSPALCRILQENPCPHVGTFIATHQKPQWTAFLLLPSLNLTSNWKHLSQIAAPGRTEWA